MTGIVSPTRSTSRASASTRSTSRISGRAPSRRSASRKSRRWRGPPTTRRSSTAPRTRPTAPVADPRPANWSELIPHREEVMIEDVDVFAGHYVTHERQDGLLRLRVTALADETSHFIEFPEPTYEVSGEANAEFVTQQYRFRYQQLITPSSVYDHDVVT